MQNSIYTATKSASGPMGKFQQNLPNEHRRDGGMYSTVVICRVVCVLTSPFLVFNSTQSNQEGCHGFLVLMSEDLIFGGRKFNSIQFVRRTSHGGTAGRCNRNQQIYEIRSTPDRCAGTAPLGTPTSTTTPPSFKTILADKLPKKPSLSPQAISIAEHNQPRPARKDYE